MEIQNRRKIGEKTQRCILDFWTSKLCSSLAYIYIYSRDNNTSSLFKKPLFPFRLKKFKKKFVIKKEKRREKHHPPLRIILFPPPPPLPWRESRTKFAQIFTTRGPRYFSIGRIKARRGRGGGVVVAREGVFFSPLSCNKSGRGELVFEIKYNIGPSAGDVRASALPPVFMAAIVSVLAALSSRPPPENPRRSSPSPLARSKLLENSRPLRDPFPPCQGGGGGWIFSSVLYSAGVSFGCPSDLCVSPSSLSSPTNFVSRFVCDFSFRRFHP